jgi:hypothetical protein
MWDDRCYPKLLACAVLFTWFFTQGVLFLIYLKREYLLITQPSVLTKQTKEIKLN